MNKSELCRNITDLQTLWSYLNTVIHSLLIGICGFSDPAISIKIIYFILRGANLYHQIKSPFCVIKYEAGAGKCYKR